MLPSLVTTARSRAASRVRATSLVLAGAALVGTAATAAAADSTGVLVETPSVSGHHSVSAQTVPAGATAGGAWKPPADTIVGVSGSALDGFTITRYDGSRLFPPTDSEARAECGEYDRRVARVRCRVEVATWYRDLGDLKLSLRWARQQ